MDWDNLIILDACRYDYFKELKGKIPNIEGELEKRERNLTRNVQFFDRKFRDMEDAFLHTGWHGPSTNYYEDNLYEYTCIDKHYRADEHFKKVLFSSEPILDEEKNICDPEPLVDIFEEEEKAERNVYMITQPRQPYIGAIRMNMVKIHGGMYGYLNEKPPEENSQLATLLRRGYRHNLIKGLYHLARLLPKLEGKIVITSAHGENLGENGKWGHSELTEEVRASPYLKVKDDLIDLDSLDAEEFVEVCYEKIFGRSPEPEALEVHSSRDRETIIASFLSSPEHIDKRSDEFSHIPVERLNPENFH